jgi:hypothetical protein
LANQISVQLGFSVAEILHAHKHLFMGNYERDFADEYFQELARSEQKRFLGSRDAATRSPPKSSAQASIPYMEKGDRSFPSPSGQRSPLHGANIFGLPALWSLGDFKLDCLTLLQALEAARLNRGEMYKHVFP